VTLASRWARRIVVDGDAFRWVVRHKPTYSQANGWSSLTVVVEQAGAFGAVLVVSLPCAHPGNWIGSPSMPVRPSIVAEGIRRAVVAGWRPDRPGAAFALSLGNAQAPDLPGDRAPYRGMKMRRRKAQVSRR
jgi:hypothetical protein